MHENVIYSRWYSLFYNMWRQLQTSATGFIQMSSSGVKRSSELLDTLTLGQSPEQSPTQRRQQQVLRWTGAVFSWQQGALSCCRVDPADRPSAAGSWRLQPLACECNRSPEGEKITTSNRKWNVWSLFRQITSVQKHISLKCLTNTNWF